MQRHHSPIPSRYLLPGRRNHNMRRTVKFLAGLSLSLGLLALCAGGLPGQESGKAQGLFNGKDLSGWVTPADRSLFTVEDGEIVGRTRGNLKKNEFLATAKPYRD